jgi:hypothetical protein
MAVRLSALRAGRPPFIPRKILSTHFCQRLSRLQGHSAAGRIRSIEKSNDLPGNRTIDFPALIMVPQPSTLLRAPMYVCACYFFISNTVSLENLYSL